MYESVVGRTNPPGTSSPTPITNSRAGTAGADPDGEVCNHHYDAEQAQRDEMRSPKEPPHQKSQSGIVRNRLFLTGRMMSTVME
jgi:hypothetical protein